MGNLILIESYQMLKHLLKDGKTRRLYRCTDNRMQLSHYIMYLISTKKFFVFDCITGVECQFEDGSFNQVLAQPKHYLIEMIDK